MNRFLILLALVSASAFAQVQPEVKAGSLIVGTPTGGNTGAGSINAQSVNVNGVPVTAGGNATSINGASVPASDFLIGTNSSGQLVTPSAAAGTVVGGAGCTGSPVTPTALTSPCVTGLDINTTSTNVSGGSTAANAYYWLNGGFLYGTATAAVTPFLYYIGSDVVDTTTHSINNIIEFSVEAAVGAGFTGGRQAFQSELVTNGVPGTAGVGSYGLVGGTSTHYVNANLLGTGGSYAAYAGNVFAGNDNIFTSSSATYLANITSREVDTALVTGASAADKHGITVVQTNSDAVRGTYDDAAIEFNNQDSASTTWKHGIQFGAYDHLWPFAADSTLEGAVARVTGMPSTAPIALNGTDWRAVTFSGYAFASPGFSVDGAGTLVGSSGSGIGKAINITSSAYGASISGTSAANKTAIQAAINAAIAANLPLYIPTAGNSCYNYTAPLTISGNLTIIGDSLAANWSGNGINVPLGSPVLSGSVLCPTSNGSDAISITGAGYVVNISNIGILFQTVFSGTGNGIKYVPPLTANNYQGLSGSVWNNVIVYGHDGNHYGFYLENFIYDTFVQIQSFGGGGFYLYGSTGGGHFGNSVFMSPYSQVIVGGSGNGFNMDAGGLGDLNLITLVRPQAVVESISGVSPGGNLPTSAQDTIYEGSNLSLTRLVAPDLETNVSSTSVLNTSNQNTIDMQAAALSAAPSIPSWGYNGPLFNFPSTTFTDTTATGTITNEYLAALPSDTIAATNTGVTISNVATLYVPKPIAGTNVTFSRTDSIAANGEIYTTADLAATGGLFIGGTTQINVGGSSPTNIGTGGNTGAVNIGGSSNQVILGSPTILPNYTVATLPTCNGSSNLYAQVVATDLTSPTYNNTLTGGGSVKRLVFCNGTAWVS